MTNFWILIYSKDYVIRESQCGLACQQSYFASAASPPVPRNLFLKEIFTSEIYGRRTVLPLDHTVYPPSVCPVIVQPITVLLKSKITFFRSKIINLFLWKLLFFELALLLNVTRGWHLWECDYVLKLVYRLRKNRIIVHLIGTYIKIRYKYF